MCETLHTTMNQVSSLDENEAHFMEFLHNNMKYVKDKEKEFETHERGYKEATDQLIQQIKEKPKKVSEIKGEYQKLKTKVEHFLHHRPSFKKQNERVEGEIKKRESEIVQEFTEYARNVQRKLNATRDFHQIASMGGELLKEYELYRDNQEIKSKIQSVFRILFDTITEKFIMYQNAPHTVTGFHVM